MSAMWPTTSEKRYVYVQYIAHIAVMTGKERETISLEEIGTVSDLLAKLDEKYPGIKEVFQPPDDIFNVRTAITLRRENLPGRAVIDPQEKLQDGDIVSFW